MYSEVCEKYKIQAVSSLNHENQKVLLRVDFNVPTNETFSIVDDSRVRAAAETIDFLLKKKSKIIIISHLGDPKEDKDRASFKKMIRQLEEILNCKIHLISKLNLDEIANEVMNFIPREREILMLDNIRFFPEEKSNSKGFASNFIQKLKVDAYVNDAFPVCHRSHASVTAIPELVRNKYAGFALLNELKALEENLGMLNEASVVTAIIGGKKVSTKIMLLQKLSERIKNIIIVGGMANTFLKASGVDIGDSFYEPEMVEIASEIMRRCHVVAPIDVVCKTNDDEVKEITVGNAIAGSICDIGPKTNHLIDKIINESDVVVWNGPAGMYEDQRFIKGSKKIAQSLAASDCVSVVGGGDTAAVVKGVQGKIDHVSNGGGAFIAWLEGSHMPGIESLKTK